LGEIGFDYVDPMILHMDSKSAMALEKTQHTTRGTTNTTGFERILMKVEQLNWFTAG
jgi:hypothetical protein